MGYVSEKFTPGFRLIDGNQLNTLVQQINEGPSSGPTYYVNENKGSDNLNNTGYDPNTPLKTIDRALAIESVALTSLGLSSVGRNAIVAFWGTQHRTSTLTWNLPATHLFGIASNQLRGKRARISVTGATAFDVLVNVTAQGCSFNNFGTFYGFNDASANICWEDTAGRSSYNNVEFLGFGDATVTTGTANHTAARALKFTGAGETTFDSCVFGLDTETRNATNYTVEISGGAPRISFVDCVFESYLGSSGTASSHFLVGASGIDRYVDLVRCRFHNAGNSGSSTMAQVLNISTSAGGTVYMDQCIFGPGATAWQTTPTSNVVMNMTAPSSGGGKAIQNA